jgi:predicted PurR-regulated permease PerM
MRNHAQEILARLPQTISTTFSSGVSAVNWVAALLIDLSLIPFYTFFFMLGLRDMRDTIYRYIPRDYRERAIEVIDHIHRVIAAFFRQRLIICLIIGAVTSIGFLICGLRFGLVLGLIIGLLSIVPFLSVIPMIPITFMVWADYDSAWWILGIWGVYAIGQSLDGILTPLIMGRDVELHPITLVVCLLIGGKIMGVLGMLLAIPLTASLKILAVEIVLPILREVADPTPASRERISLILSGRRSARDGPDGARQATPRLAGASSAPAQSPVAASSTRIEDGGLETASEGATSEQKPAEEQPTEAGASPDAESPSALPRIGPDEGR